MEFNFAHLDLNAAANRGIKVSILHPQTKQPIGTDSFIRILGSDSEDWKKADRRILSERKDPTAPMNKQEHDEHIIKILAAVTTEVSGIVIGEPIFDEPVTYTAENVLELYTLTGFHWIPEQVLEKAYSRRELDLGKKD